VRQGECAHYRRECLDHVLIVGERHLRRMLASYSSYYNESRTHLTLEKDTPLRRAIQRCGAIIQFFPDCTIAMCGYDFRKGQVVLAPEKYNSIAHWPC
jgi:hypothetical protein